MDPILEKFLAPDTHGYKVLQQSNRPTFTEDQADNILMCLLAWGRVPKDQVEKALDEWSLPMYLELLNSMSLTDAGLVMSAASSVEWQRIKAQALYGKLPSYVMDSMKREWFTRVPGVEVSQDIMVLKAYQVIAAAFAFLFEDSDHELIAKFYEMGVADRLGFAVYAEDFLDDPVEEDQDEVPNVVFDETRALPGGDSVPVTDAYHEIATADEDEMLMDAIQSNVVEGPPAAAEAVAEAAGIEMEEDDIDPTALFGDEETVIVADSSKSVRERFEEEGEVPLEAEELPRKKQRGDTGAGVGASSGVTVQDVRPTTSVAVVGARERRTERRRAADEYRLTDPRTRRAPRYELPVAPSLDLSSRFETAEPLPPPLEPEVIPLPPDTRDYGAEAARIPLPPDEGDLMDASRVPLPFDADEQMQAAQIPIPDSPTAFETATQVPLPPDFDDAAPRARVPTVRVREDIGEAAANVLSGRRRMRDDDEDGPATKRSETVPPTKTIPSTFLPSQAPPPPTAFERAREQQSHITGGVPRGAHGPHRTLAEQITRVPPTFPNFYRNSDEYREVLSKTPKEPGCLAKSPATTYDPRLGMIRPKYKPGPKRGSISGVMSGRRMALLNAMRGGRPTTVEELMAVGIREGKAQELVAAGGPRKADRSKMRRVARNNAVRAAEAKQVAESAAARVVTTIINNPGLVNIAPKNLDVLKEAKALLKSKEYKYGSKESMRKFLRERAEKARRRSEMARFKAARRRVTPSSILSRVQKRTGK